MSKTATLDSVSNALDTQAKWLRVMQKAGVTHEQFILPMNDKKARHNLAAYLAAGCPKLPLTGVAVAIANATETSTSSVLSAVYQEAVEILGADFITPEEVTKARPSIVYTVEQITALAESLPSEDVLKWCKQNGYAVMPAPPTAMSMLDVREILPDRFCSKTVRRIHQKFVCEDETSFGWLLIKKMPVANSTSKMWHEQNKLLSVLEKVPNAAEMCWFITTYFEVRGVRLFEGVYVRTSSLASDGRHVDVGSFDDEGLHIDAIWDGFCLGCVGLSAARK